MQGFTYWAPTKVIFGKDTERQVGDEIKAWGGSKVLIHYGSGSVKKTGLLDRVKQSLTEAGLSYVELGGVVPNPRLSKVYEGIDLCRREKVDFILGVGGGSVLDSAKAVSYGACYDGDVWDFYDKKGEPQAALPVCSIITLAATGSEMSKSSVITKEEGLIKRSVSYQLGRPKFAILNPELTYTLPPYQTSCGVTDIMMHTMDRYFATPGANEMTDAIAEALLRTMIHYGPIALKDPTNYEARSEIMWAGSLSHNDLTGLGRMQDFAPHQIEVELSGMYDVAHGAGLAAIWASWARYVVKTNPMRFARFGANVWGIPLDTDDPMVTALAAIDRTEAFFKSIDMPINIRELTGGIEIDEKAIEELAIKCTHFGRRTIGTFQKLGKEEIMEIYRMAK